MRRRCIAPPVDLTGLRPGRLPPLTVRTFLIYLLVGAASGAAALGLFWLVAAVIDHLRDLAG